MNDDKRVNSNSKNKLRTYRKFKSIFKLEPYLLFGTKQQRKLLTKFRISAHNLNIEKGDILAQKLKIAFSVIYAKTTLRMKFISLN